MGVFCLKREQFLPVSIDRAWDFFSAPANLSKITPPGMSLNILTKLSGEPICAGMKISYIVKPILKIPLKWTTEITWVLAPFTFIDKQVKGPYALWEHTHTFTAVPGGVKMNDEILYKLPFGFLGRLVHFLVVKKQIAKIFNYRRNVLEQMFGKYSKP